MDPADREWLRLFQQVHLFLLEFLSHFSLLFIIFLKVENVVYVFKTRMEVFHLGKGWSNFFWYWIRWDQSPAQSMMPLPEPLLSNKRTPYLGGQCKSTPPLPLGSLCSLDSWLYGSTCTLHPLTFRVSFLYSSLRSLDGEGFQKNWEHSSQITKEEAKSQA
jgi:hypothetical protein